MRLCGYGDIICGSMLTGVGIRYIDAGFSGDGGGGSGGGATDHGSVISCGSVFRIHDISGGQECAAEYFPSPGTDDDVIIEFGCRIQRMISVRQRINLMSRNDDIIRYWLWYYDGIS